MKEKHAEFAPHRKSGDQDSMGPQGMTGLPAEVSLISMNENADILLFQHDCRGFFQSVLRRIDRSPMANLPYGHMS